MNSVWEWAILNGVSLAPVWSRWALACALVAGISCGGRGGAPVCGAATACGGDVAGGWSIRDDCVLETSIAMTEMVTGCEDTYTGHLDLRMNGTFTFGTDQTYVSESTLLATAGLLLTPSPCYKETCDELTQQLQSGATAPDSPISGGFCASAGAKCRCTITFRPVLTAEQGTYAVYATTLSMTPDAPAVSRSTDFCVAGDELRMNRRVLSNTAFTAPVELQGGITLVRQL